MANIISMYSRPAIAKVVCIIVFILILSSIYIIAQTPGVRGYEISIYDEYPMYFWYFIISCIFICQIIIFSNIFFRTASSIWKAAFVGIVLCNSIVVLLPLIRRYTILGSEDVLTHMGYMLDIQHTGHIGYNTYPMAHILGIISHYLSGFDLSTSALLYPFIFYILYIISFYILCMKILDCKTSIYISIMLTPLLYLGNGNVLFLPQGLSNLYLIFVLYLFFHNRMCHNSFNYAILIVVATIFLTFFHPLTPLFLVSTFLIYDLSCFIVKHTGMKLDSNNKTSVYLILIILSIFFTWQSHAYVLLGTFKQVYAWFYEEAGEPAKFEHYSELISEINPNLFDLIKFFIFSSDLYGLRLFFMVIGVVSIIIILKGWKDKKFHINEFCLTCLIGFTICFLSYIVSQFIIYNVSYVRFVHYAVIFSIIITSLALGNLLERRDSMSICYFKLLCIVVAVLLFCIVYLSVFCVHTSSIIHASGQHVTDSQLIGMDTFFEKRYELLHTMEGGISASRMKDGLYGNSKKLSNIIYYKKPSIPHHFNYTSLSFFGDYYSEPVYVVISMRFRIMYPKNFPEYPEKWRFNQTDFFMLENDKSVSKVYSNQEIDIYLLIPISSIQKA